MPPFRVGDQQSIVVSPQSQHLPHNGSTCVNEKRQTMLTVPSMMTTGKTLLCPPDSVTTCRILNTAAAMAQHVSSVPGRLLRLHLCVHVSSIASIAGSTHSTRTSLSQGQAMLSPLEMRDMSRWQHRFHHQAIRLRSCLHSQVTSLQARLPARECPVKQASVGP